MTEFARKADGRRVFTVDFKRETVGRIVSGEKTLAELFRELGILPSVLRNWMRLVERGGTTAVAAGEASPKRWTARAKTSGNSHCTPTSG
jgi:transposase-like protein